MNILEAIGNKFQFKVANADSSDHIVALIPGHYDVLGMTVTQAGTSPFAVSAVTPHFHNATNIRAAGWSCDVVADDGDCDNSVTCTAILSQFKIRQFLEFLRFNPVTLREMIIQADDDEVFENTLTIASVTPLTDKGKTNLNLADYYDRYQQLSNKIVIPNLNLPIDDTSIMQMTINDGRTVTFTFKF